MKKLFLSHRLDLLASRLFAEAAQNAPSPLSPWIVLVASRSMKQWLLRAFVDGSAEGVAAGYKIYTLQEGLSKFFPKSSRWDHLFCHLFQTLSNSQEPEVREYASSEERIAALASELAALFLRYAEFGVEGPITCWQRRLFEQFVQQGKIRFPAQAISDREIPASIHCFGFDFLSKNMIRVLQSFASVSLYLFSPCSEYWGDARTSFEKVRLQRYWKGRGASSKQQEELDQYLEEAPQLLANWGKLGRVMLDHLDVYDWEVIDDYTESTTTPSTLRTLQQNLVHFSQGSVSAQDGSIVLSRAGSSRLQEIEHLHACILQWIDQTQGAFAEISVLAPDIEEYAPLIECVFSDLPYRILGVQIRSQSFFDQGMHRLFDLGRKGAHVEDLLCLLENPSFCSASDLEEEALRMLRQWLVPQNRLETLEDVLLQQAIYLFPKTSVSIVPSSFEMIEQWMSTLRSLKEDLLGLSTNKTLPDWADFLRALLEKYLAIDLEQEADALAWNCVDRVLRELSQWKEADLFPFLVVQTMLQRSSSEAGVHSSHWHAIRFASLQEGAIVPARALFLIGMDEESFPRKTRFSSLDLLRQGGVYCPNTADWDRYLLLQALFAARDYFHVSYRHISAEEGKPIQPSFLIEELCRAAVALPKEAPSLLMQAAHSKAPLVPWPSSPNFSVPKGEFVISLSDLSALARHPWEFYLKKTCGVSVKKWEEEESFVLLKSKKLKQWLRCSTEESLAENLPLGLCGEALKVDLLRTTEEWKEQMRAWDTAPRSVLFRLSCQAPREVESGWEMPALTCHLTDDLQIKVVGEVHTCSSRGFLHRGADSLPGLVKIWPEYLAIASALNLTEILCLQTGKIKTIGQPKEAFHRFLRYYFLALSAPSPLLADWAPVILRKEEDGEWEKLLRDGSMGKKGYYEDPVLEWVYSRVEMPSAHTWRSIWQPLCQEAFSDLRNGLGIK